MPSRGWPVIWLRFHQQTNRARGICSAAASGPTKPRAKSQRPRADLPDTRFPATQLFDLWVLRRFLEIAAPGPYYLVLKHAILEPNEWPHGSIRCRPFWVSPIRLQANNACLAKVSGGAAPARQLVRNINENGFSSQSKSHMSAAGNSTCLWPSACRYRTLQIQAHSKIQT